LITPNWQAALRRLKPRRAAFYWIDSIYIDQSSVAKKNVQVPLMGQTYFRATEVVIYLGPGTFASDRSFRYLKDISVDPTLQQITSTNDIKCRLMETNSPQRDRLVELRSQFNGNPRVSFQANNSSQKTFLVLAS
jgi:hypothetical protein